MKLSSLSLASLFLSLSVFANSPYTVGDISIGGTGCSSGAEIKPNGGEIGTLSLEKFKLSARKGTERKSCTLAIPIQVAKGHQIAFGPISEIKGFASLPSSTAKLNISQEVFLVGTKGKVVKAEKKGELVAKYEVENKLVLKDLRWSACGASTILRVNVSAVLTNPTKRLAFATVESIDLLKKGRLYWRQCD